MSLLRSYSYEKLLEIEKEMVCEVFVMLTTTGENLQIEQINVTQLICACELQVFSGCVKYTEKLHTHNLFFLFPIVFLII